MNPNIRNAGIVIIGLAVTIILVCLLAAVCHGQCPGGQCEVPWRPSPLTVQPEVRAAITQPPAPSLQPTAPSRFPFVCRVKARKSSVEDCGTGVLVWRHPDPEKDLAYVVTAYHVIRGGPYDAISVHFPDGKGYLARIQATDKTWDVAVLAIRRPDVEAVALAEDRPETGATCWAGGYGDGRTFRLTCGRVLGYASPAQQGGPADWVRVEGTPRGGDSGGPILNAAGRLIGMVFGGRDGEAIGPVCTRLRTIFGPHIIVVSASPRPPAPNPLPPASDDDWRAAVDARLTQLESDVAKIGKLVAIAPQPGPQGLPGKDGRDGVDGKDGLDGADGKNGEIPLTTLKEIVADEVAARMAELPPLRIQTLKPDGTVHQDAEARLGDLIRLKPVIVSGE